MDSRRVFYLLVLFLLHSSAVSAHVESVNRSKAVESSSIKIRGVNLQSASACFEFSTSADAKTATCRELNLKSNSRGNVARILLPSVDRDTQGMLVIKTLEGQNKQEFPLLITNRTLPRPRSSNQVGSITGNVVGCTGLDNNSFSVHLASTSGSVQLDSNRSFTFVNVPTGTYKLIVKQYGMEAARLESITVQTGSKANAGDIMIRDCGGVADKVVTP